MLAQKFLQKYYFNKTFIYANLKTDKKSFSTSNPDKERDIADKDGPAIGEGIPDNKHQAPRP